MPFQHLSEALQNKIKKIDDTMKVIEVTREAGAGLVKATVNGEKKLLHIEIDEKILQKEDKVMLQDLITAATNLAINEVEERVQEEREKATMELFGSLTH